MGVENIPACSDAIQRNRMVDIFRKADTISRYLCDLGSGDTPSSVHHPNILIPEAS
jgi:hypothetical protein